MRTTIHLVSARDYWPYAQACSGLLANGSSASTRATPREMRRRAAKLRAALLLVRSRRRSSTARAALGRRRPVPPSGTWERRRADLYGLAEQWVGPGTVSEAEGIDHLVRSYLRGFGPRRSRTSRRGPGSRSLLAPALERLRLRRFRDERGRELVDLPVPRCRRRHAGAGSLPALVGRSPARARAPHGLMPRSTARSSSTTKNPPSVPDLSRRRPCRGRVALRRRARRARALRAALAAGAPGATRGGEPAGRVHERRRMSVTPSRTEATR